MKKIGFSLAVLLFIACKTKTEEKQLVNNLDKYSCHFVSDSLVGKQYLNETYLESIDKITTNEDSLKSNKNMVFIKGGVFNMGADKPPGFEQMEASALPQADEYPKHKVELFDFFMDTHEVTVREYAAFVKATGYKTVAEYDIDWEEIKKQLPPGTPKPKEEMLKAGALVFNYVPKNTPKDDLGNWWTFTAGVNWKNPDGSNPDLNAILDMPVTQISWYDALAYAKWVGKRLPTEAEFEYAMRGGKEDAMYPWGNDKLVEERIKGNFLQGSFPYHNTGKDGFLYTAPVKSFEPNAYGLYDMAGNVWEWTMDWYGADYYNTLSGVTMNPTGPVKTNEVYDTNAVNKVVRGGSFLCNDGWCSGYRNSRRMRLSPDTGMQHLGFRCVKDATN